MFKACATVLSIWVLAAFAAAAEGPEILVELERDPIYEGESVLYSVTLNHVQNPSPPQVEETEDFSIELVDQRSQNSSHVTIINGRMTKVERFGMTYYYRLTPRKTGTLLIPAPTAKVDGERLAGRPLQLRVIPPQNQDTAILEISVDREFVYPLQPFTVTLDILIRGLPSPYDGENPLSVQRSAPALSIPWVDDPPEGIRPEMDVREWLGSMENRGFFFDRGSGFTINNIASFFPTEPSTFLPKSRRVQRQDGTGATREYWAFTLTRTFIPERPGSYSFGPVSLKGGFGTRNDSGRGLVGENIFAMARPKTITVKDVPEAGRPEGYTGAIGTFELDARITPTRARVGDPLTLTLLLKGEGTLERTQAPDLQAIPEVADRFKIYEATVETQGSTRTFTYSLRALSPDIQAFPSLPMAYFDVERERYVTLRTDPIPLKIEEADQLADQDIVTTSGKPAEGLKRIEARKEGIFANITDPGALRDERVRIGLYLAALAGMAGFYFLAAFLARGIRRRSGDEALRRRRGAQARALHALQEGREKLRNSDLLEGTSLLKASLAGLIADAADLPEAGMTPREVRGAIAGLGLDETIAARAEEMLERLDAARFGAASDGDGSLLAEHAERLVFELLGVLKKQGRLR